MKTLRGAVFLLTVCHRPYYDTAVVSRAHAHAHLYAKNTNYGSCSNVLYTSSLLLRAVNK